MIFGLKTQTYASTTRAETDENVREMESQSAAEENSSMRAFMELTQKMDVNMQRQEIYSIFQLPKKTAKGESITIVKLNNQAAKKRLLSRKKSMTTSELKKIENIYINEDLTHTNQELFRSARRLKKEKKVEGAWTRDGKIYVKKNGGQIVYIRHIEQLTNINE